MRATTMTPVDLEEQYAVALGVLSVLLLIGGTVVGLYFRHAPARVVRAIFPVAAIATGAAYAIFVWIARYNVKG